MPNTPSSLASFKPRLVLPFWYRLSQAVLEKRPLNGRGSSSSRGVRFLKQCFCRVIIWGVDPRFRKGICPAAQGIVVGQCSSEAKRKPGDKVLQKMVILCESYYNNAGTQLFC